MDEWAFSSLFSFFSHDDMFVSFKFSWCCLLLSGLLLLFFIFTKETIPPRADPAVTER